MPDADAQLRALAHEALKAEMEEVVQLRVDADVAMVSFMDGQNVAVPLGAVVVTEGQAWVRVDEALSLELPLSRLHVQVLHTIPNVEQLALAVDGLDPQLVNVLMAEESALGSAEDPLGLIAVRAVTAALRGARPGRTKPPPDETLG